MNPVFWALIAIAAILLWFLLSGLYKWIGKVFSKVWHNSIDQFTELIEKQKIDKWSGEVPMVQGSGAATIVDVDNLGTSESEAR